LVEGLRPAQRLQRAFFVSLKLVLEVLEDLLFEISDKRIDWLK
jgi:hypothetical protein